MRVEACDCEIMKVYSAILCHTETSGNQISNSFIGLMMRIGGQIIMDFLSHYHGLGSWVNEIIGHQTFIKILSKQSRISWLEKQQKRFHKNLVKIHIYSNFFYKIRAQMKCSQTHNFLLNGRTNLYKKSCYMVYLNLYDIVKKIHLLKQSYCPYHERNNNLCFITCFTACCELWISVSHIFT